MSVLRGDAAEPILVHRVPRDRRPYLHPIAAPGGSVAITEDAPTHHPWQHGLYLGLNDVDGTGFWTEGLDPDRSAHDGTFHPEIVSAVAEGTAALWTLATEYRDPRGTPLLRDRQEWRLDDLESRRRLELRWTLRADRCVRIGAFDYGGLFLRMPFRRQSGGSVLTSEGDEGETAGGRRARWASLRMPVPGRDGEVAVAMMDHPENLEHPVPWRVDRHLGINPAVSIAGAWTIPTAGQRVFRYRMLIAGSPLDPREIEAEWNAFAAARTRSREPRP